MHSEKLTDLSQTGLHIAIQDIKDELFDTPECDYAVAQLLNRWGLANKAERVLDEMLMKWGTSPEVMALTQRGYAEMGGDDLFHSDIDELALKPQKIAPSIPEIAAA